MKLKLVFGFLFATLLSGGTFAAIQTYTDRAMFDSKYGGAATTIDFSSPALASFTGVTYGLSGGNLAYEVREDAWSSAVRIGTLNFGGCCWTSTTWFGTYISPTIYDQPSNGLDRIYIGANISPIVLSLETSAGFFGVVFESLNDGLFSLPTEVTIDSMSLGYSALVAANQGVPEPSAMMLALMAFGALAAARGRTRYCESHLPACRVCLRIDNAHLGSQVFKQRSTYGGRNVCACE